MCCCAVPLPPKEGRFPFLGWFRRGEGKGIISRFFWGMISGGGDLCFSTTRDPMS